MFDLNPTASGISIGCDYLIAVRSRVASNGLLLKNNRVGLLVSGHSHVFRCRAGSFWCHAASPSSEEPLRSRTGQERVHSLLPRSTSNESRCFPYSRRAVPSHVN